MKKGDFVALRAIRSPETVLLIIALASIGAVAVMTDRHFTVRDYVRNSGVDIRPQWYITNEETPFRKDSRGDWSLQRENEEVEKIVFDFSPKTNEAYETATKAVRSDELFMIIFTSGSTGKSKAVMLSHANCVANPIDTTPMLREKKEDRAIDLLPQLKEKHDFSWDNLFCGLRIMLVGFFYKCVVADFFALFVDSVFGNAQEATGLSVLIASALFIMQMYCDFAGYSEIATGAARMMGVKLTRNFNRPYLSVSYTEFFRRWHITLNRWFTDYVYIPLGGNRKGKVRKIINTFVVFLLCGLWHGANWTYVLWGVFAAVMISMESVLKKPVKSFLSGHGIDVHGDIVTLLRRIAFWLFLTTSAILFRSTSVEHAGEMFVKLFTAWNFKNGFLEASLGNLGIGVFSILQIVLCVVCVDRIFFFGEYGREREEDVLPLAEGGTLADSDEANRSVLYVYVLLAIAFGWIALLSAGDSSAFAYFQF